MALRTQVYKITNKLNGKYYVGVHSGDIFADDYWGSGKLITYALNKYGKANFAREVIAEYDNVDLAYWMERCIVGEQAVKSDMCYNIMFGGMQGWLGMKHSKETILKMKGWVPTEETKKNMSNAITEWHKNNPDIQCGGNNSVAVKVQCIQDNCCGMKVYDTRKECADTHNVTPGGVGYHIQGKTKQPKFKYYK